MDTLIKTDERLKKAIKYLKQTQVFFIYFLCFLRGFNFVILTLVQKKIT